MRRRDFIIFTSLATAGIALGVSDISNAGYNPVNMVESLKRFGVPIKYPHGGCTESSIANFDRGPSGRDPFGIYS